MTTLTYYWVATYEDGATHPQFNPDGTENAWGDVRQDDVIRVSWCQFPLKLSRKIEIPTKWVVFPRKQSLDYEPGDKIIICRRNHINFSARGEKGRKIEYILGRNDEEIIKL